MLEGGPRWSGKSAGRLHSAGRYAGAKACILTVSIVDGAGPRSLRFPVQAGAGASASGADATSLFGNLFIGRPVRASSTPLPPRVLRKGVGLEGPTPSRRARSVGPFLHRPLSHPATLLSRDQPRYSALSPSPPLP